MNAMISLALTALAVARVTRFVTTDRIFLAPRRWLITRLDREGLMAYLIVCDWCVSVYAGAAGAAAWWVWGDTRAFLAVTGALAFSYVAGFLAEKTGE